MCFKKFKNLFSKKITVPENCNFLCYDFITPNGKINLGMSLLVPENWIAYVVSNSKILDEFPSGEYKLTMDAMPLTTRKLKLNHAKNGKIKMDFRADIIFLNLNIQENQKIRNTEKIRLEHPLIKKIFATFKGELAFKLIEPRTFLSVLLNEYAIIRGNMANIFVSENFSEDLTRLYKWGKPKHNVFDIKNVENIQNTAINIYKPYQKVGIQIVDLKITEIKKSDNLEKFNQQLSQTLEEENLKFTTNTQAIEETLQTNTQIQEVENSENENTTTKNSNLNIPANNIKMEYATCQNCGAQISKEAKTCFNCGMKTQRTCSNCHAVLNDDEVVCHNCSHLNPIEENE